MGPFEALTVLTTIGLVLLALACAGLLRQIRELRAEVGALQRAALISSGSKTAPQPLLPTGGARVTAALLVSPGCQSCHEVLPAFVEASRGLAGEVDPVLLSWDGADVTSPEDRIRTVLDTRAYRFADPGWTPALALIDTDGLLVGVEPAGEPRAVAEIFTRLDELLPRGAA